MELDRSIVALLVAGMLGVAAPAQAKKIGKQFFCSALFSREGDPFVTPLSEPVARGHFRISTGTRMAIRAESGKSVEGQLIGRYVKRDRSTSGYLFYHEGDDLLYVVPPGKLDFRLGGKRIGDSEIQPILDPFEQVGETCMANAGDYFLHTIDLNGLDGVGPMDKIFADEEGRLRTYGEIGYQYYQVPRNNNNMGMILDREIDGMYARYKKKPPFKCESLGFEKIRDGESLISLVKKSIDDGSPVLAEFFIGGDMTDSKTRTLIAGQRRVEDPRLWLPRARGEKSGGGHGVVLTQYFTTPSGKLKLVVGDGDWNHVRVWDADEYLAKRYATSKMIVHFCRRK